MTDAQWPPLSVDVARSACAGALAVFIAAVAFAVSYEPPSRPLTLLVAPSFDIDDQSRVTVEAALAQSLGEPVRVRVAESEGAAIESAQGSAVDAWLLPTYSYLFCHDELGARAELRALRRDRDGETLFVRRRLAKDKRDRLIAALTTLAETHSGFRDATGIAEFARPDERHYAAARRALLESGQNLPDVVPGGWILFYELRKPALDIVP